MQAQTQSVRSPVILGSREGKGRAPVPADAFRKHAGLGFAAAAALFFVGSVIDLVVLWVLQRQSQPEWEFIAITRTVDAYPRFVLAIALLFGALYLSQSTSLLWYRLGAAAMLTLGVAAVFLGILMVMNYFALASLAAGQTDALAMLRSSAFKAVSLSGIFALLLIPLGAMGLRRPRIS
jgi:hypothetical protein